jgi:hypothetical protein
MVDTGVEVAAGGASSAEVLNHKAGRWLEVDTSGELREAFSGAAVDTSIECTSSITSTILATGREVLSSKATDPL